MLGRHELLLTIAAGSMALLPSTFSIFTLSLSVFEYPRLYQGERELLSSHRGSKVPAKCLRCCVNERTRSASTA